MSGPKPRTGARRAGSAVPAPGWSPPRRPSKTAANPPSPEAGAGRKTRHRGVHWQQTPAGVIRWWNDDAHKWVRYRPGADAPPRPPGWEGAEVGGPVTNKAVRAKWRSPYRLVPIVLMVVILAIAIIQATGGSESQSAAETKAADKLVGKCLKQNGTADGHPRYSTTALACSTPGTSVKVLRVLPGTPGSPACPAGETGFALPYPGVRYPHVECVVPVGAGR